MWKRLTSTVLALILALSLGTITAPMANAATEGDYEYEVTGGKATITKYTGNAAKISIPAKLGGAPVTAIGLAAFYDCTTLTSVTIPNGVTSIGNYAFDSCSNLSDLTVPDSVTSIGFFAFTNCWALESFTIPKNVTVVSNGMFVGCFGLTKVTLPDGVTSIGNLVFNGCNSLKSINIPNSVTSIGFSAFYDCTALKSVTIPDSVTSIGENAFDYWDPECVDKPLPNLTISCTSGSVAHTYAKDNKISFKLQDAAATYTVKFNTNGGSGTMKNQTITTGKSTKLTANAFTRKGYIFAGWATSKTDSVKYKNSASVKDIAKSGKTITLYAKWTKVSAPTKAVTSLKLTSPKTKQLKVTYKAVSGADGYRIEYSTDKNFTKAATKTVHTTKLSYTIKSLTAKKKYYVRVTAFHIDSAKVKYYSKKTAANSLTVK